MHPEMNSRKTFTLPWDNCQCYNQPSVILSFPPAGAVWKAHYVTPIFSPPGAGACYDRGFCPCFGEGVTHHEPPLLFELSQDPSEAKPLSADTEPLFDTVIRKIGRAIEEHRRTLTPVPEQLSVSNVVWKPWLQPCCGTFPFCWCDKEGDNKLIDL